MEGFLLLGWKGGFYLAGSGVLGSKGSRDRGSNLRLGSNVRNRYWAKYNDGSGFKLATHCQRGTSLNGRESGIGDGPCVLKTAY